MIAEIPPLNRHAKEAVAMDGNQYYKKLNIWKNAFPDSTVNGTEERLQAALEKVRDNVSVLGQKINANFPELVGFDVTHMDALWDVADLLVDEKHELNPLEIFILGCAFYLQDAALCFHAYREGQEAVRNTNEWKDAQWRHTYAGIMDEKANLYADVEAIWALHARQAEAIASDEWQKDANNDPIYIIEDAEIRRHHGQLIGKIAASHHWDIESVAANLDDFQGSLTSLSKKWKIRPILLACILRCSDAAQIDGRHLPDRLLNLFRSDQDAITHWIGQNKIGAITTNQNSNKLFISSTCSFEKSESLTWWMIYDLVQKIEKELKKSNELIAKTYDEDKIFRVDGVEGNTSPKGLGKKIKPSGWTPAKATIKVGDVERIVSTLGGELLYGEKNIFAIVARELIQNAMDAILARRKIDASHDASEEILIELIKDKHTSNWILRVADKGIGMSKHVLLNVLLDFGRSFWTDRSVSEQFPGLQSGDIGFIGKFGIGFFSVFSIAKCVTVFSRKYDDAYDEYHCLEFNDGLTLRPIFSSTAPESKLRQFSTIIDIKFPLHRYETDGQFIFKTLFSKYSQSTGNYETESFNFPFTDYIASLVCNVRANIEIRHGTKNLKLMTPRNYNSVQAKMDLYRLSFNGFAKSAKDHIGKYAKRMRVLKSGNKIYGFAALADSSHPRDINDLYSAYLCRNAIGGLCTPDDSHMYGFVGWMESKCLSSRRDAGEIQIPKHIFNPWLEEQISLFLASDPDDFSRTHTAGYIANFGGDPKSVMKNILLFPPASNQPLPYPLVNLHELIWLFRAISGIKVFCVF